jgi:glycosyltransferase involved in cell wall biosynthesis
MARRLERATVASADAVAIVSEMFAPYLRSLGVPADRLINFPNWSRVEASISDRREVRAQLGWAENVQVVLHSGNMGLKQGLEQVTDAARIALRRGLEVRFVLSGDGSQRPSLAQRAEDLPNVSFLPIQPDNVFPDLLAAADVLLLSERASVSDMSLPSKLTSYFAAGRPVLAAVSTHGATAQEIARSCGGIVVPAGHPEAMLAALQRLRSDELLRSQLAEAGREYAAATMGRPAALRRIESFLELIRSPKVRTPASAMKTA